MADQCIRAEYDSLASFMASLRDDLVWQGDKGLSPRLADQIQGAASDSDILASFPITVFYERTRVGVGAAAFWECKFYVIPLQGTLAPLVQRIQEEYMAGDGGAVWKASLEGDDASFTCTW